MAIDGFDLDWLISVDDHVLEPPDLWVNRLPSKYRDLGPRLVDRDGEEAWVYEDKVSPTSGLSAAMGTDKATWTLTAMRYDEMRIGAYDASARVLDMDIAGILASLCFPSFPRFCGQVFLEAEDKELALLGVKAYNDWMAEEWCGSAPGRFIPLGLIPLWDPRAAASEIRRNADRGFRAVCFSENPKWLGLPTIWDTNRYWNPVWDACQDTNTVVCMHIGSSSKHLEFDGGMPWGMERAWATATITSGTLLSWLLGPVFREFPGVQIALSEGGIGWIPYHLERGAQVIDRRGALMAAGESPNSRASGSVGDPGRAVDVRGMDIHQIFTDHVYGCFIDDFHGVSNVREIGIDNVMIETDYPHSDSTWPNCVKHAHEQLAHDQSLTDEEKYRILQGNARRVFQFEPAPVLGVRP
jgi:predicted TIM-barrel fold metal-dependent hydrolase